MAADEGSPTMAMTEPTAKPLLAGPKRSDARRNREKIIRAAVELFGEEGFDAQMDDVAERAGFAVGTVYRHFPSKDALIQYIILDRLRIATASVERAARHPEAWDGLVELITAAPLSRAGDRLLYEFYAGSIVGSADVESQRRAFRAALGELIERAKDQGRFRRDVSTAEFSALVTAVSRIANDDLPTSRRMVQHCFDVVLAGLEARD